MPLPILLQPYRHTSLVRYGTALTAVLLATAGRAALTPVVGDRYVYVLYYLATLVTAALAGLGPTLLAIFLGGALSVWVFTPPTYSFVIPDRVEIVGLVLFVCFSLALALFGHLLHRAVRHAEAGRQALELQMAELEQARATIRQREEWYRALVEHAFEYVSVLDARGCVLYSNPAAARPDGRAPEEVLGAPYQAFLPAGYVEEGGRIFAELLSRPGEVVRRVIPSHHVDGSEIWLEISARNLLEQPAVRGIVINWRDVTEQRRSEQRFRQVVDAHPASIALYDAQRRFELVNEGLVRRSGLRREELLGRRDEEVFPPEVHQGYLPALVEACRTGQPQKVTAQMGVGGQAVHLVFRFVPLTDEQGRVRQVAAIAQDVTDLKRTQAELEASQRRLEAIFRSALEGIVLANDEQRYVDVNPAACAMLGYSRDELLALPMTRVVAPPASEQIAPMWQTFLAEGATAMEIELLHRDGRRVDVEVRAVANVLPGLHMAVWRDASARKEAERALRDSEAFLRSIYQGADVAIFVVNVGRDGRLVFAGLNPAHERRVGIPTGQFEGKAPHDLVPDILPADEAQAVEARYRHCIAARETIVYEERLTFQGRPSWWLTRLTPLFDEEGRVWRVIGTALDITLRKQIEAEREEAFARVREFETLFRLTGVAACVVDLSGRLLVVNPQLLALLGRQEGAVLGARLDELMHPDDRHKVDAELARVLADGTTEATFEARCLSASGAWRWLSWNIAVDRPAGRGYLAALDVSELKQTLEDLRRSQKLLVDTGQMARIGGWELRIDTMQLAWSEEVCRLHEVPVGHQPSLEEAIGYYTPEARPVIRAAVEHAIGEGAPWDLELPFLTAAGRRRWGRAMGRVEMHEGRPVRLEGCFQDITERKQAELELREREAQIRALADNLPSGAVYQLRHTPDGQLRCVYISAGVEHLLGLSPEAVVADYGIMMGRVLEEDCPRLEATRQAALAELATFDCETRMRTAGGEVKWLHARSAPRPQEDGSSLWDGVLLDVTGRREAENALRESEARFLAFMENTPALNWIVQEDGRLMYCNGPMARWLGEEPASLLGRSLPELFPPGVAQNLEGNNRQVLHTGRPLETVEGMPNPAGVWRAFLVAKFLIPRVTGRDGKPHQAVGVSAIDITERQEAERRLRERERFLAAILDGAPLSIQVFDAGGTLRRKNAWTERLLGLPPGRLEVDHYRLPDDAAARGSGLAGMFQRALAGEVVEASALQLAPATARRPPQVADVSFFPVRNDQGSVEAVVVFQRDVSERRALEQRIQESQKLESLGVLAGGIAHDFNNLLTGILGHAELARMTLPSQAPAVDHLRQLERSSQRAAELCRQMLAYAGKGRMVIGPVDLNALVRDTLELLRVSVPRQARLVLHLGDGLPPVEADASQVHQVVMNLVLNAGEALPEGEGQIVITTRRQRIDRAALVAARVGSDQPEGDYVLLEVADTGAGMDPDTQVRIFEPFFTTKFTGRGLGMSAVLGIVRAHKGALWLSSTPGRGTTFRICLPISSKPLPVAPPARRTRRGQGTVLVVDDEETVRKVAAAMLGQMGYEVVLAANGREALDELERGDEPVHLVLLDLTMPEMAGDATLEALRQTHPDLPVVLMSGYSEAELSERFAGKGVAGFLEKPFGHDALQARLNAILD